MPGVVRLIMVVVETTWPPLGYEITRLVRPVSRRAALRPVAQEEDAMDAARSFFLKAWLLRRERDDL